MTASPNFGTTVDCIDRAEDLLGVKFPDTLKQVWLVAKKLELPGGWLLFPVFDPADPRKTASHVVYENTVGRWDYMPAEFVSIAEDGCGNYLVLRNENGELQPEIYHWDHETNRVKRWSKSLDDVLEIANKYVRRTTLKSSRA